MDKKAKNNMTPPIGLIFNLKGVLWKVGYRNPGQLRFSAEGVAALVENQNKERRFILLDGSNKMMTPEEFDVYAKEQYPQPTLVETRRPQGNPNNVTLDVHNGGFSANAIFQKRK